MRDDTTVRMNTWTEKRHRPPRSADGLTALAITAALMALFLSTVIFVPDLHAWRREVRATTVQIREGSSEPAAAPNFARLYVDTSDNLVMKKSDGSTYNFGGGSGGGAVTGPASSVDSELALFDGTTGKLIQGGSGITSTGSGTLAPSAGTNLKLQHTNAFPVFIESTDSDFARLYADPSETGLIIQGPGANPVVLDMRTGIGTFTSSRWFLTASGSGGLIGLRHTSLDVTEIKLDEATKFTRFRSRSPAGVIEDRFTFGDDEDVTLSPPAGKRVHVSGIFGGGDLAVDGTLSTTNIVSGSGDIDIAAASGVTNIEDATITTDPDGIGGGFADNVALTAPVGAGWDVGIVAPFEAATTAFIQNHERAAGGISHRFYLNNASNTAFSRDLLVYDRTDDRWEVNDDFVPAADASWSLGAVGLEWLNVYTDAVRSSAAGALTLAPGSGVTRNEGELHTDRLSYGVPDGVTLGAAATAIDPPDDAGSIELTGDAGGNTVSTITSTGFTEGDQLKITVVSLGGGITLTDTASPGADEMALTASHALTADSVVVVEFTGTYWRQVSASIN